MINLKGKTALVTGGTRGIGRSIVLKLAEAGADVAFTYRSSSAQADELKAEVEKLGVRALAFQSDAANAEQAVKTVSELVAAWGRLDVLVNNAGVTKDGLLMRMTEADWDLVINTNLKSVFNYTKAVMKTMMSQRSGKIINISSVVGSMGNAGQANYAASKAGIAGFSKSVAKELASRNITCNVVAPGWVETDMTSVLSEDARNAFLQNIPLKRSATPNDIANACLFLSSDLSNYITGQVLHVDGGMVMA
ncbi:MAG: 3-oxoacyl-[acyl-carrier-protein] reductase [Bacteroidetes bacterium]|nr:3-oxoacyl-[acyl-carrier-protein] reductase [Bacteroidota bacterium]